MLNTGVKFKIALAPKTLPTIVWQNSNLWYNGLNYFYMDLYYQNFQNQLPNLNIINPLTKSLSLTYEDLHDEWFIHNKFNHLYTLSFTEFFIACKIDIPVCFRNSKSLNRYQREFKFVNFVTYFMRHGKRLQMQNTILKTLTEFMSTNFYQLSLSNHYSWKTIFLLTQSTFYTSSQEYKTLTNNLSTPLAFTHRFYNHTKHISYNLNFLQILFRNITSLLPMFSFYIYKVDKKIFKNTRGKSGKYTFIWKFVAPYKRLSWAMYWLVKELKTNPGKTLASRLSTLYYELVFNPQKTWLYRVKRFSYNYVYRNARTTLAESYRTTTK